MTARTPTGVTPGGVPSFGVREAAVLALAHGHQGSQYVRHAARGRLTVCGAELGSAITDPPDYDRDRAPLCNHAGCRAALEALNA